MVVCQCVSVGLLINCQHRAYSCHSGAYFPGCLLPHAGLGLGTVLTKEYFVIKGESTKQQQLQHKSYVLQRLGHNAQLQCSTITL